MTQRSRAFCFTWNNYTEEDMMFVQSLDITYGVFGREICPTTGTPHIQGYIYYKNPRYYSAVKKRLEGAHVDIAKGDHEDNYKYCTKSGKYEEVGIRPKPGKRTDLEIVRDRIMEGESVDTIVIEDPQAFHQYGRTLERIETIQNRNRFRTWMTKGIWYTGATGVGKSHKAFENYHPKTHYVYPNDNGWWDGYNGQEIVILNDFRGEINFQFLLRLVDKWPEFVRRRGREPAPFLAKTIIVTSVLTLTQIYGESNNGDDLEQLLRRFDTIQIGDTEVPKGNNRP